MTNLVRWDPFADLRSTMDRLFDEGFSRPWRLMPPPAEFDALSRSKSRRPRTRSRSRPRCPASSRKRSTSPSPTTC